MRCLRRGVKTYEAMSAGFPLPLTAGPRPSCWGREGRAGSTAVSLEGCGMRKESGSSERWRKMSTTASHCRALSDVWYVSLANARSASGENLRIRFEDSKPSMNSKDSFSCLFTRSLPGNTHGHLFILNFPSTYSCQALPQELWERNYPCMVFDFEELPVTGWCSQDWNLGNLTPCPVF